MAAFPYRIGAIQEIEQLQVHSRTQATEFAEEWSGLSDYIRFEFVTLPDRSETVSIDLVLRADSGDRLFILLATTVQNDMLVLPSIIAEWAPTQIEQLASILSHELSRSTTHHYELRALHENPLLPPEQMTIERVLPGFRDYTTAVNHVQRYRFIFDKLKPGSVIECACGTGYGASILAAQNEISEYVGVDLSDLAVTSSRSLVKDLRFEFRQTALAQVDSTFDNVVSLETIEHTPNPYRFMRELVARLKPDGRMIISLPTEYWGGSHRNPYHLSNWTYARAERFFAQFFQAYVVFKQQLSLLGPTTFDNAEVFHRPADEDTDECFVVLLERPTENLRRNIVVKRSGALGDVIWTTPLISTLRRQYPELNLVVVTAHTDVFIGNPDVDLVCNLQYEPLDDDILIDLDLAYERRRNLHILDAYAEACNTRLTEFSPRLYPSPQRYQAALARLQPLAGLPNIEKLLVLHCAANSPDRIWARENWVELIHRLLQHDERLFILIVGSGRDFSAEDLGLVAAQRVQCFTRKLDLMGTAAIVSVADAVIAPDSGVIHVAAAMSTPAIALFGMATPDTRLDDRNVNVAVWAPVECRGCIAELPPEASPRCKKGDPDCMRKITVEQVASPSLDVLARTAPCGWRRRFARAFGRHA